MSQKNPSKFNKYRAFRKRGELIKKKQELQSWSQLYTSLERFDTFKPESQRYLKSLEVRTKLAELEQELVEIENIINTK